MSELPAQQSQESQDTSSLNADAGAPQFRYVEEFVRYQLSQSLGGARGMIESALPFIAFTIAWVAARQLYPAIAAAVITAALLAIIRLVQRQSIKYVVQAVIPTVIAVLIATRTGRAQDIFLPGILYNGALAVISLLTVAIRKPLVGFIIGAAVGDPTGWTRDRGLVRITLEADPGASRALHHSVRHPAAALSRWAGGAAGHRQGRPRLADADRRPDRDRVHALQGQDTDGGFCVSPIGLEGELPAERYVILGVLRDCLYAGRGRLGDVDRPVARGQHFG